MLCSFPFFEQKYSLFLLRHKNKTNLKHVKTPYSVKHVFGLFYCMFVCFVVCLFD